MQSLTFKSSTYVLSCTFPLPLPLPLPSSLSLSLPSHITQHKPEARFLRYSPQNCTVPSDIMAVPLFSSSEPIESGDFTVDEIRFLVDEGIFVGPYVPGSWKRTVKMSALYHPLAPGANATSTSNSPNPNESVTISFRNYPTTPSERTLSLPISVESAAALEFIGFISSTAARIFANWSTRPDPEQCPDDLLCPTSSDMCAAETRIMRLKITRARSCR